MADNSHQCGALARIIVSELYVVLPFHVPLTLLACAAAARLTGRHLVSAATRLSSRGVEHKPKGRRTFPVEAATGLHPEEAMEGVTDKGVNSTPKSPNLHPFLSALSVEQPWWRQGDPQVCL